FAGRVRIPTLFSTLEREIRGNAQIVADALAHMGPHEPAPGKSKGLVWSGVHGTAVRDLIRAFSFHPDALEVRSAALAKYIEAQLAIGELTTWTVALMQGDDRGDNRTTPLTIPGIGLIQTVKRAKVNGADDPRQNLYKVR